MGFPERPLLWLASNKPLGFKTQALRHRKQITETLNTGLTIAEIIRVQVSFLNS